MPNTDTFFTQSNCSRCPNELNVRIMSWFNNDTICLECSAKEKIIKRTLRERGMEEMEGCGYVPNI